ncbi:uncharacterized protein PHALS_12050 [Plasmopara halstedii]|uniref:RxLR-like protein n=1 Tax=Plasmopara halstedii TaxID=4781 RepID=A0A0P1AKQ9_PLAHL|nr:uncharacterized protein PHALS_12050 [Plasmopara halstedii]CEG41719.1 hypothetical protein PHALS_12050 [Plasmopara halstedii]|eukprot:XP_024578088.1 hypothetical protein PHALS_12050 [Plasmopara halstedii]
MFVPVLSTLLLLEFSVSSTTNSSIIHDEDQVVFVGHLNDSMLSANTTPSVANGELERSNDSKQVIDETIGEVRTFPLFEKFAKWFAKDTPVECRVETASNLMKINPRKSKQDKIVSQQVKKLFESDDGALALFAEVKVSKLLKDEVTRELTEEWFTNSHTKLSALFSTLMKETKEGSLDEFFQLQLHVPLYRYAWRLYEYVPFDLDIIATDVARLLTENRKGGTLITWFGTYATPYSIDLYHPTLTDNVRLVIGLSRHPKTLKLAYRLHALYTGGLVDFRHNYIPSLALSEEEFWFNFAAFVRFNYIEHEARSLKFMYSEVAQYSKKKALKSYLSAVSKAGKFQVERYVWLQFGDDYTRLLKAALQSDDNTNYVSGALTRNPHIAEFKKKLNDVKLVKTFEQLLSDGERVELLLESVGELVNFKSSPGISGVATNKKQDEIVEKLQLLVTDEDSFQLLKISLNDEHLDSFFDALDARKHLKLVEDMLSSTEINTVKSFKDILEDQNKVQSLAQALLTKESLENFRMSLDNKNIYTKKRSDLVEQENLKALDELLNDLDQVFFLRVAVRDNVRAELFRAALEKVQGKEFKDVLNEVNPVETFEVVLNKRNLVNVFKSALEDEKQLECLKNAVSVERREEFKSFFDSRDQKMFYEELEQQLQLEENSRKDFSTRGPLSTPPS